MHHGRTPPCTDAIIDAGIVRVVIGVEDPDPNVAGRGIAALRDAGIDVVRGGRRRGRRAAGALPQAPEHGATLGRPEDGCDPRRPHGGAGRHQPIDHRGTGPSRCPSPAGALRRGAGGAGTVRADDPELTVRLDDGEVDDGTASRCASCWAPLRRAPASIRRSSSRETSTTCWTSWAAEACSSSWSRGARPSPTTSTWPASSIAMSCTSHPNSSGVTTPARFSPAPGLARLAMCGRAGWSRSSLGDLRAGGGGLMGFSEVQEAIDAIGRLGMAVVVDDQDRENEGDLVMAAEAATPENIAFFLAHTSGVICVPLLPERADMLDLPLMVRPTPRRSGPPSRSPSTAATERPRGSRRPTGRPRCRADRPGTARRLHPPRPHLPAALPDGGVLSAPATPRRRSTSARRRPVARRRPLRAGD